MYYFTNISNCSQHKYSSIRSKTMAVHFDG